MFVACGLNHKTAPVDVRERLALPVEMQDALLNKLVDLPAVDEAAILSTCNRTEFYCHTDNPKTIIPWLAKEQHLPITAITPYFYVHPGHHGVRHTLRVASGLDSMMLGEPQIFGQMKQAYQLACDTGAVRSNLRPIFEYVFNASKRIRNHSGIGNNPISIAFAAAQLVKQFFNDLKPINLLIIGSGEMSSLVTKYLHKQGVERFIIASRREEKAEKLAKNFSGKAITISDIPLYLSKADVVVSSTACPLPFISKKLVEQAMSQRQAPMFFLDLAVPRDIEPNVSDLNDVKLYNIDDLKSLTEKGMGERQNAAIQAEHMVDIELENYLRRHRSQKAKAIICDYRHQMNLIAQQELHRAQQKLTAGHCQSSVLTEFSERLVNKLTHAPTVGLRQAASDNRKDMLDLAQYLFNASPELYTHEKIT